MALWLLKINVAIVNNVQRIPDLRLMHAVIKFCNQTLNP